MSVRLAVLSAAGALAPCFLCVVGGRLVSGVLSPFPTCGVTVFLCELIVRQGL